VINGIPGDNNKYTQATGNATFTLTIHNTDITDGGDYKCSNGFDESQLKRLNIECNMVLLFANVIFQKQFY
jgi:hypothetical protein